MKTAAIVCEYNPFHYGHRYQIAETRRRLGADTGILCLMSGNYVQRGEPAIYDKYLRAETAVRNGADLVLELPITCAMNAAGYFASGAVSCIDRLGGVDYLSFGSECGDGELLTQTAKLLASAEFEAILSKKLRSGISYAAARSAAMEELGLDGTILAGANNALGIEYIRALRERNSRIQPLALTRSGDYKSASELREILKEKSPAECLPSIPDADRLAEHRMEYGERAMLAVLRTLPEPVFRNMAFESEGIWSKVMKACRMEESVENILMACKSKRYAYSRMKRTLIALFLGMDAETIGMEPKYLRVLAFNERGREILHSMKKTSELPLIAASDGIMEEWKAYYALESRAADLYGLFAEPGIAEKPGEERREHARFFRND